MYLTYCAQNETEQNEELSFPLNSVVHLRWASSMYALEWNTGGEMKVSREKKNGMQKQKQIKEKNETICKTNAAHLCSCVTPTGPNYITVRG